MLDRIFQHISLNIKDVFGKYVLFLTIYIYIGVISANAQITLRLHLKSSDCSACVDQPLYVLEKIQSETNWNIHLAQEFENIEMNEWLNEKYFGTFYDSLTIDSLYAEKDIVGFNSTYAKSEVFLLNGKEIIYNASLNSFVGVVDSLIELKKGGLKIDTCFQTDLSIKAPLLMNRCIYVENQQEAYYVNYESPEFKLYSLNNNGQFRKFNLEESDFIRIAKEIDVEYLKNITFEKLKLRLKKSRVQLMDMSEIIIKSTEPLIFIAYVDFYIDVQNDDVVYVPLIIELNSDFEIVKNYISTAKVASQKKHVLSKVQNTIGQQLFYDVKTDFLHAKIYNYDLLYYPADSNLVPVAACYTSVQSSWGNYQDLWKTDNVTLFKKHFEDKLYYYNCSSNYLQKEDKSIHLIYYNYPNYIVDLETNEIDTLSIGPEGFQLYMSKIISGNRVVRIWLSKPGNAFSYQMSIDNLTTKKSEIFKLPFKYTHSFFISRDFLFASFWPNRKKLVFKKMNL